MSVYSGPEITNDGLVFAYDMVNQEKSWRGAPVTNLAKNLSNQIDWSIGNLLQSVSISTITLNEVYRITSTSGTGTSFRIRFNNATLVNGATYTVSYKYRFISGGLTFRANDWCDQSITRVVNEISPSIFYETATGSRSTYDSTFRFLDFEMSNNTVVEIWDLQLEERSFATPYSSTQVRTNTQSILDLTSRNTVTASSLTYASDGTFSFNGSGNNISIPSVDFSSAQTIEIWLKPEENDGVRRNPYNQAYGGYGTWTHEPSGVINYYYGDAGANNSPYIGHTSNFSVAQNEIACVCTTRDTSTSWWYKNGVQYNSYSHGFGSLTTDNSSILIGTGYAGSYLGKIYAVKLYNRALSATEVQQNFNAMRGRFGI
jgi:hypothetical protein